MCSSTDWALHQPPCPFANIITYVVQWRMERCALPQVGVREGALPARRPELPDGVWGSGTQHTPTKPECAAQVEHVKARCLPGGLKFAMP